MRCSFVAMFHQVNDPIWFEDLLLFLGRRYQFIDADEIERSIRVKKLREAQCHLSFDDGHRSFFEIAMPVLNKHRIPASLFVSPEIIVSSQNYWFQNLKMLPRDELKQFLIHKMRGRFQQQTLESVSNVAILKSLKYEEISGLLADFCSEHGVILEKGLNLNASQLKEIVNTGLIEVGAHTLHHPILANENDDVVGNEITQSVMKTQELTQRSVRFFACPNGGYGHDFGEREIKIMKRNGVIMNFSTKSDHLRSKYDAYRVPRIGISKGSHSFINFKIQHPRLWSYVRDVRNPNSEMNQRKKVAAARL